MVPTPDPPPPAAPGRPRSRRWPQALAWGAGALALLGAVLAVPAILGEDVERRPSSGVGQAGARRPFPGFGEGRLKVLVVTPGSSRSPAEHCSLLAETAAAQARGLMTRRDLGGYASMVFPYAEDVSALFYNRSVPMALTVAFFDGDGRWVSSSDLEPCPDMDGCPTIGASAPFRYAVEVEKGGLARLGLGPGSQIDFVQGC